MDIDIIVEPDLHPEALVDLGREAERLGIRALWMSNYYAHWDPFVTLVPLAQNTTRLKMGVLAISPFESHPMKLANATLSLNEISGGRAMIAVGPGEGQLKALNLTAPPRLVGAMREAVELIRAAAHRQMGNGYDGEFFKMTMPAPMDWVKASPPPVYGTAYREQMMRMYGRVADGCFIGATRPEDAAPAVATICEGIGKRETAHPDFRITAFWAWHIKADRAAAYDESSRELLTRARLLDAALICRVLDPAEVTIVRDNFQSFVDAYLARTPEVRGVPAPILHKLCDAFTSTGGIDDIAAEVDRFRLFREAGLTELGLRLHDDPMAALKLIGEHVVPAFAREAVPA